jgi:hypothetical protein
MQHTAFDYVEPGQTSLEGCEHHSCVIVQSVTPSTLGVRAGVPVMKTEGYPTKDGKGIFILWNKECVTVHSEDPSKSDETTRETRTAAAPRRPPDSIVGFYPKGIRGDGYLPIKEDCCISTLDGESYIFRRNGGVQGPYPPHIPAALVQPPRSPSDTSQDLLQHHFGVQNPGLSNHVGHCLTRATTVDPRYLNSNVIDDETAGVQNTRAPFISGNSINNQSSDGRCQESLLRVRQLCQAPDSQSPTDL